jgi:hypothetical protein
MSFGTATTFSGSRLTLPSRHANDYGIGRKTVPHVIIHYHFPSRLFEAVSEAPIMLV